MLLRLGLLSLLLLSPRLEAQPASPFGINAHAPEDQHLEFLFDKIGGAGIGWVRIDFIWAAVEHEPGAQDWEVYDDIVAAARSRNLQLLALIGYTPAWATDGAEISGVPRNVTDWTSFCYRAAERYRDDILHWEVWNEPNLRPFWSGNRLQYIDDILVPAASALRAANPDARVGGPALSHSLSPGREWHGWLLDILDEAGDELDFLTHHAYDHDDGADGVTRRLAARTPHGSDPTRWGEEPPSLGELLNLKGWNRPIWLTETGWLTTRLDERRQAGHYQDFLDLWLRSDSPHRWLDKVFFYELQDSRDPRVNKLGLLRVSGREKPAYRTYRAFIASHPPTGDTGEDLEGSDGNGGESDGTGADERGGEEPPAVPRARHDRPGTRRP